jgi:hypothetical protein
VRIERGLTGRNKMVVITGLDRENSMERLRAAAGGAPGMKRRPPDAVRVETLSHEL